MRQPLEQSPRSVRRVNLDVTPRSGGQPGGQPGPSGQPPIVHVPRRPLTAAQLEAGRQAILARGLPGGSSVDGRPLLHVVWIGSQPPQVVRDCIESWRRCNPTWRLCVWTDHRGWINQGQIERMREWNGKCDLMRYEILWAWGGVVVDADSEAVAPLDGGDFRACLEGQTKHDAFAGYENETCRGKLIACGFMGGRPGSALWRACIEACAVADMRRESWVVVGPELLTRVAARVGSVHVYPSRSFIPQHHTGVAAPGNAPIYARQLWGNTRGLYGGARPR